MKNSQGDLIWGKCFDREGNRLPKTVYVFVHRMDTDHILKLLDNFGDGLGLSYRESFKAELKNRGVEWRPQ